MPYDRNHRLAARSSLTAGALLAAGLVVLPAPSFAAPDPTIAQVQERVGRLYHEAEVAAERWNTSREELFDARVELRTLRSDLRAQQQRATRLRDQLGAMVATQAQSSPLSTASQLLAADDADSFLSGVAAVQAYSEQQAGLVGSYRQAEEQLVLQQEQMGEHVAAIADEVSDLHQAKAEVDAKAAQAQTLLNRLKAERRQRVEARIAAAHAAEAAAEEEAAATPVPSTSRSASAERPPTSTQASGSAQAAVSYALAQVGDAYAYGSAGPSSWDCSGLTMVAWGAGGVSLPHSSTMQAGMGTPVSVSQLQPGDLVFYYSPISHVGMYIGNGQLVHAANPSAPVEVVPVDSMPIAAIRRVG